MTLWVRFNTLSSIKLVYNSILKQSMFHLEFKESSLVSTKSSFQEQGCLGSNMFSKIVWFASHPVVSVQTLSFRVTTYSFSLGKSRMLYLWQKGMHLGSPMSKYPVLKEFFQNQQYQYSLIEIQLSLKNMFNLTSI